MRLPLILCLFPCCHNIISTVPCTGFGCIIVVADMIIMFISYCICLSSKTKGPVITRRGATKRKNVSPNVFASLHEAGLNFSHPPFKGMETFCALPFIQYG